MGWGSPGLAPNRQNQNMTAGPVAFGAPQGTGKAKRPTRETPRQKAMGLQANGIMGTANTMARTSQVGASILLRRARAEGHRAARLAGPTSRNIEHPLKKILLYRRCNQFTDELANPHIS